MNAVILGIAAAEVADIKGVSGNAIAATDQAEFTKGCG